MLNSSGFTPNTNGAAIPAKSFLWGATGEQEWTPAITTGMLLYAYMLMLMELHEVFCRVFLQRITYILRVFPRV